MIPSKSALDEHEVSGENFDMDANDSSKQGPEPEIGTEIQNGPESEVPDGGNTSINVPGVNIGTGVILPGEGGLDDKIDGSTVNHLILYCRGSYKCTKNAWNQNKNKKKKKRKKRNRSKRKKTKRTKEKTRKTSSYCKEQDWKIST
jgi:hypothetical protein